MPRPSGNLLSLWDSSVPVPKYPTFHIALAKGGEPQHIWSPELGPQSRPAEKGELLRDPDMKFVLDVRHNLNVRVRVKEACQGKSTEALEERKRQIDYCRSSILYFVNMFCWTLDPRLEEPRVPFVTFPFQDDVLTWMVWLLAQHEDGVIEKSRDMGASWMVVALFSWLANFYPAQYVYLTSLREEDVDDGTEHGLFGKLRFIQKHLPKWMRNGWEARALGVDKQLMMTLPGTGSVVKGQKTESTGGRSGRARAILADEFAHVQNAFNTQKAFSGLASTVLYISTHTGHGNEFSRMCDDPMVHKKSLHYDMHPLKNPEWKAKERAKPRYSDETWDQEHEMKRDTTTSARVFPRFISSPTPGAIWQHVRSQKESEAFRMIPGLPVITSTDYGLSDPAFITFAQWVPPVADFALSVDRMLLVFDEIEDKDLGVWELRALMHARGYVWGRHIGDFRTGKQRGPTQQTWIEYFASEVKEPVWSKKWGRMVKPEELGPPITVEGSFSSELAPIESVRTLLSKPGKLAIVAEKCPKLIRCLQNWAFPIDRVTRQALTGSKPLHDQWSHGGKSLCYLVHAEAPGVDIPPPTPWENQTQTVSRRFN